MSDRTIPVFWRPTGEGITCLRFPVRDVDGKLVAEREDLDIHVEGRTEADIEVAILEDLAYLYRTYVVVPRSDLSRPSLVLRDHLRHLLKMPAET